MEDTTIFGFPIPSADDSDPPDGPAQIGELGNAIEDALAIIEGLLGTPSLPAAPAPGQLVIVNGTSDPVYKAATGDLTINSAGVTAIGAKKVLTAMLNDLAVTEAKLGASAVTTAKIAAAAVETAKLANLGVTEAKLAEAAVSAIKLAASAKNLFPQLSGASGSKFARGQFSIFVTAEGNSANTPIFHGMGVTPNVQLTPVVANGYGGRFDTHVTEENSSYFAAQVFSGALPEAVVIQVNWYALS